MTVSSAAGKPEPLASVSCLHLLALGVHAAFRKHSCRLSMSFLILTWSQAAASKQETTADSEAIENEKRVPSEDEQQAASAATETLSPEEMRIASDDADESKREGLLGRRGQTSFFLCEITACAQPRFIFLEPRLCLFCFFSCLSLILVLCTLAYIPCHFGLIGMQTWPRMRLQSHHVLTTLSRHLGRASVECVNAPRAITMVNRKLLLVQFQ